MDDFFLSPSDRRSALQVPFLLKTCDEIRSLSLDQLQSRDLSFKQLAAWMQDHLFFKVLEKFLNQDDFDPANFSSGDEPTETPHLMIDHIKCHQFFLFWQHKNINPLGPAERADYISHTKAELIEKHRVTEMLETLEYSGEDSGQLVAKVALSIKLLLGTLSVVVENVLPARVQPQVQYTDWLNRLRLLRRQNSYESLASHVLDERAGWPTTVISAGCSYLPPVSKLLVQKLEENHFCHAQAVRLCKQFGIFTINYLCRTDRTLLEHIKHETCTDTECFAYSNQLTSTESPEIHHTSVDCIQERTPDIAETVRHLIAQGSIPLVRLEFHLVNDEIEDVKMSIVK